MPKFSTCGLMMAIALCLAPLRVYAEPPPAEPGIVSTCNATAASCTQ